MNKLILGTLLTTTLTTTKSFAATGGGNGGDVIRCEENGQVVYRTLDSVVMENEPFYKRREFSTSKAALDAIIAKFYETLPSTAHRLQSFVETFEGKVNDKRDVFWIKADLYDVKDENLYYHIPSNCSGSIQAVNLVKNPFKRYYYNPDAISKIEEQEDELSWLLIHEWLRDYLDDSDIIRIANAYLHSDAFASADALEIRYELTKLGIERQDLGKVRGTPRSSYPYKGTAVCTDYMRDVYPKLLIANEELEAAIDRYEGASRFFRRGKSKQELYDSVIKWNKDLEHPYSGFIIDNDIFATKECKSAFYAMYDRLGELRKRLENYPFLF